MKKVFSILFLLPALAAAPAQGAGVDALAYQMCEMTHKPEMRRVNVSPEGVALGFQPCEIDVSESRSNPFTGQNVSLLRHGLLSQSDCRETFLRLVQPKGKLTNERILQHLYDMYTAIQKPGLEQIFSQDSALLKFNFKQNQDFLASIFRIEG